jgi:competence protein ComEC
MSFALSRPRPAALRTALAGLIAAEQDRLVLWLPVFMGTGVLIYFGLRQEPPLWAGAALAGPALAGALLARGLPRAALAAIAALGLGLASAQFATLRTLPIERLPFHAVILAGRVAAVEALPDGRRVTIAHADLGDGTPPLARRVRIRLRATDSTPLATGDLMQVRALVRAPSPPAYPGGWDLQRDAFFNGLAGYGFAIGPAALLQHTPPRGFAAWLQHLREHIAGRLEARLAAPEGAIAATLFTGVPSGIPETDREAFRASGLAHLLAVAGLHIAAVMGAAFGISRALLALSERAALFLPVRQVAAAISLLAGLFYLLLTGAHVPIIRSFAMAALFTLAVLLGRRAVSVRSLGLAATVLMLVAPQEVPGASFQLSFSAVLALISGYEALRPALRALHGNGAWWRRLLGHIAALALTSLLAGGASAPFGAYHFGRLQIYFIAANMVAVPITALWIMPLGLLALALMPMGLDGPVVDAMGWGVRAVLAIARAVTAWPDAVLAVPHMPGWGLALVALGIAWLGLWRTGWLRLLGLLPLLPGLLSPCLARPPDLLISADGHMAAVHVHGAMLFDHVAGASRFTRDEWAQYWASGPPAPLPVNGETLGGAISCAPASCWLRPRLGAPAALLLRGAAPEGCAAAAVILSLQAARGRCPGPALVDRVTARINGAVAIWLTPAGPKILTDHAERGDRPWVPQFRRRPYKPQYTRQYKPRYKPRPCG